MYEGCDGLRRAVLSVNLLVYEGCDGLRRAVLSVNLLVYKDKKAAQREERSKAVGFAFSDESECYTQGVWPSVSMLSRRRTLKYYNHSTQCYTALLIFLMSWRMPHTQAIAKHGSHRQALKYRSPKSKENAKPKAKNISNPKPIKSQANKKPSKTKKANKKPTALKRQKS